MTSYLYSQKTKTSFLPWSRYSSTLSLLGPISDSSPRLDQGLDAVSSDLRIRHGRYSNVILGTTTFQSYRPGKIFDPSIECFPLLEQQPNHLRSVGDQRAAIPTSDGAYRPISPVRPIPFDVVTWMCYSSLSMALWTCDKRRSTSPRSTPCHETRYDVVMWRAQLAFSNGTGRTAAPYFSLSNRYRKTQTHIHRLPVRPTATLTSL